MNGTTSNCFCTTKETINEMKRQPSEWVKIFANDTSDKQLISQPYKDIIQLNTKNKIELKKGQET